MTLTRSVLAGLGALGCAALLGACASSSTAPGASTSVPSSAASATPAASPAATGTPATSPATGTSATGTAACAGSSIAVTLTHTGALGGQAGGYLTFTNKGTATCRMTGWPSVTGVSKSGASAALAHAQSTMYGAWRYASPQPVVTLAPGSSAYAVVAADDNPAGTASACPAPYADLRVAVPGSSAVTTVSAYLPGAGTYLPTCTSVSGKPTDETSDIVPLSSLAH